MAIYKSHEEFLKRCDELVVEAIKLVKEITGMDAEQWCLVCDNDQQQQMLEAFRKHFGEDEYGWAWNHMFQYYGI